MKVEEYLKAIEKGLGSYHFGGEPDRLYEPIRYILSIGGKRIRPVLTLMSCHLFRDDFLQALYPAMGVEVFHNFTLLHDDIMDDAPIRRGMATVHEKWDANTAILSGDVMMIKAYDLFLAYQSEQLSAILSKFNRCATEVCEGQQLDMLFETTMSVNEQQYLEMIRLKTAVLVAFSLELGAIIGGALSAVSDQLYQLGLDIGIGFQLKDDLLDVYAQSGKFGKQVGGDIISNKKTYLLIKALQLASKSQKKALQHWLDIDSFDPVAKVEAVKDIYDQLRIQTLTEQKMNAYFDKALTIFDNLPVASQRKQPLKNLVDLLISREK